jgi:hypothetical protein
VSQQLAVQKIREVLQRKFASGQARRGTFNPANGDPSKSWHQRFRRDNPEVRARIPSRHSAASLRASRDPVLINTFFKEKMAGLKKFRARRIFTFDEQAIATRKLRSRVYIVTGNGTSACAAMETEGLQAHTSLVNCMCLDPEVGALPTGILQGGRVQALVIEDINEHCFSMGYTRECT